MPGHVTIAPFYWAPNGYAYTPNYKTIINGYIANVAADTQKATNVFSVGTQYYQQPPNFPLQHIQYVITAGSEIDDNNAYPSQNLSPGCTADPGFTACVSDGDLQLELLARLQALSMPIDDLHVYMVMFPQLVETCDGPGSTTSVPSPACSTKNYCAYHFYRSVNPSTNSYLLYGNEPFPDLLGCNLVEGAQAPNGDAAGDTAVSLLSHEANETITDWRLDAWFDSARPNAFENGDLCAYVYGHSLGGTSVVGLGGNLYNQVINGAHYYTQDEFSNEDFALSRGDSVSDNVATPVYGCVQQDELPVATFPVSGIVAVGSSTPFNGSGSSDPDNLTALIYSWVWGDGTPNSTGANPTHTFATANTFQVALTVTDVDGWSASVTHPVSAAFIRPVDQASAPAGGPGSRIATTSPGGQQGPRAASIQLAPQTVAEIALLPKGQAQIPVKPLAVTQSPQPAPGAVGPAAETASASTRPSSLKPHHATYKVHRVEWPELVLLAFVATVKRAFNFL